MIFTRLLNFKFFFFLVKKTPFHVVESLLDKAQRIVRNLKNVKDSELCKLESALVGNFLIINFAY